MHQLWLLMMMVMMMMMMVQVFNTRHGSWTKLSRSIPRYFGRLAAAPYDDRIIVIGADFSGVFNPETDDWAAAGGSRCDGSRPCGTGVCDFGLAVDDGRLYVLGGRRYNNAGLYETTDEVKSVHLAVLCGGDGRVLRPGDWRPHARLPRSSLVSVYGLLNIPSEV